MSYRRAFSMRRRFAITVQRFCGCRMMVPFLPSHPIMAIMHRDIGPSLRLAAVVSACLLAAACGRHGTGAVVPSPPSQPAPGTLDHLIVTKLSAADRALLLSMARHLPANVLARATSSNTKMAIAIMDGRGRIVRQFSNRSTAVLAATTVKTHARQSPSYAPQRAQSAGQIASDARQLAPQTVPTPGQGFDLYHTLTGAPGTNSFARAHIIAPCNPTLTGTDAPYLALGGYTDSPNSQLESGEQLIVNADPSKNAYQPYIRYGGSPRILYPGDSTAAMVYPPTAQSGSPDGQTWVCGSNQSVEINQIFFTDTAFIDYVNFAFVYGTLVGNSSWIGDPNGGFNLTNLTLFGVVLPNDDSSSAAAGWHGWVVNPGCAQCHLTQTTAIGMDGPHPGDGSVYGPVQWSSMVVGGLPPGVYSECSNSPSWTNGGNECGNSPANPLSSVIQVSGQSLQSTTGAETVTIDNSSHDTFEVKVDPELYVFPEIATAATAASAATRRPQAIGTATGCNSEFDVKRTKFQPLRYQVHVACRNARAKDVKLTFSTFTFNDPASVSDTSEEISLPCGPVAQNCSTAIKQFPLLKGGSETIALSDGYVEDTNGGRSYHHATTKSCKEDASLHPAPPPGDFVLQCFHLNDRGWPYPAYAIHGFGGVMIAGQPTNLIGFPGPPNTFQDCYGQAHRNDKGCDTKRTKKFVTELNQYYKDHAADGYVLPADFTGLEAHHILPLAWGGQNAPRNGIWLPEAIHSEYSHWWCYFSLDGRWFTQDPPAFCRPPFPNLDDHRL